MSKMRFAPLVRVSTERQELQGESLKTQTKEIIRFVQNLKGVIPDYCWKYSGQEHATPNSERAMFDELLLDASKGVYDAVIVVQYDRFSRDSLRAKLAFEIFKENGIKFFIGANEVDLYDPDQMLSTGIYAEVAENYASKTSLGSIKNRIERAKGGRPTSGNLPVGRTFDKKSGKWGIDKEVQSFMESVAKEYTTGGSLSAIAKREGVNYSTLLKNLKHRCGDNWQQRFRSKRHNIDETVNTKIPRMLDEDLIASVHKRAESNRTVTHGSYTHEYLLSRIVICEHCGKVLSGQINSDKKYYRHSSSVECGVFRSIPAAPLEDAVMIHLFALFRNKSKIEEATKAAIPDYEEIQERRNGIKKNLKLIKSIGVKKEKIVSAISDGAITSTEARKKMDSLRDQETLLDAQVNAERKYLGNVPTKETVGITAMLISATMKSYYQSPDRLNDMSFKEKRMLLESIFAGKDKEGKRFGIYVKKEENRWAYRMYGDFVDFTEYLPMTNRGGAAQLSQSMKAAILGIDFELNEEEENMFGKCHAYHRLGIY